MAWPTGYTLYDKLEIDHTKVGGGSGTLTDYVIYVAGSTLSSQFWATVRTDGGDIRASLDDGTTELPIEVVAIDTVGETAEIHFKATVNKASSTTLRLWYNGSDTAVAENATYGAQNVWTQYEAVYHLQEAANNTAGGYKDSTANNYDATGTSMSLTAPAGPIEGKGQDFDGSADYITTGQTLGTLITNSTGTVSAWANTDVTGGTYSPNGSAYQSRWIWADMGGYAGAGIFETTGTSTPLGNRLWSYNFDGNDDHEGTTYSTGTWYHTVWRHAGGTLYNYQSATAASTSSGNTSVTSGSVTISNGYSFSSTPFWDGKIDEVRFANVDLGADWLETEYNNQSDPATFYAVTAMGGGGSSVLPDRRFPRGLNRGLLRGAA